MKHKTAELDGALLDAAVAKCEGHADAVVMNPVFHLGGKTVLGDLSCIIPPRTIFSPSTNWAQGGQIIERERISMSPIRRSEPFPAANSLPWCAMHPEKGSWIGAPTPLIAAMRAYVSSKFGDEVEIQESHTTDSAFGGVIDPIVPRLVGDF